MNRLGVRRRFWLEVGSAFVTGLLAAITIVRRDWVELILGVEPDHGSGLFEVAVTVVVASAALLLAVTARTEWRGRRTSTAN